MRSCIATVSVSGSLEEKLPAIAAAGFDGIELFEADLIASPMRPPEIAKRVTDLGLAIEMYQLFRDFEALPAERFHRNLRRAAAKLELMATLGVDLMLVCSNVNSDAINDRDLAAEHLRALGDLAADAVYASRTRRSPGAHTCATTSTPTTSSGGPTTRLSGSASTASTSCRWATASTRLRRSRKAR